MNAARVKVVNVRPKLRLVETLPSTRLRNEAVIRKRFEELLDLHTDDLTGYAIVAWGRDLGSTCDMWTSSEDRLPAFVVPAFVQARLTASKILQMANRDAAEMLGDPGA